MTPKEQVLAALIQGIPYPQHISDLDLFSENAAIRFSWREHKFRISITEFVEEVRTDLLMKSDLAILLEALLFRKHTNEE